ncbi:MAG: MATE family efflux transporter [Phycisphaerae bacterium]
MTATPTETPALGDPTPRFGELRHVIAVTIPTVITTSSRAVMDIADFVMIKWMKLDAAQAAILPAQMVMFTYIVIGMGIVSMVNTFAAQCLGRKRLDECSAYGWQVLYVAAFFGLLGAALIPLVDDLIAVLNHAPDVAALEVAYARVALLTAGPTIAAAGLGGFFIGIHRPMVTMWSALEANVVNVVVSYCLIFGVVGPPLGIAGAAWGTLAGVTYRTARLLLSMTTRGMHERFRSRAVWRPSLTHLRGLLRVGAPCGLQWFVEVTVWALFVTVLIGTTFGKADLIATNTAWQYMRIAFMPTLGASMALSSLVGKSIGAGQPQRAIRQTRIAVALTFAYMGVLSTIYAVFGAELIGWFNRDPEVIRIGIQVMLCAAVFQLFDALGISYNGALRGAGDTFVPSVFFVVSTWVAAATSRSRSSATTAASDPGSPRPGLSSSQVCSSGGGGTAAHG